MRQNISPTDQPTNRPSTESYRQVRKSVFTSKLLRALSCDLMSSCNIAGFLASSKVYKTQRQYEKKVNTKYYKSAILTQNTPVTKHVGFGSINGNA